MSSTPWHFIYIQYLVVNMTSHVVLLLILVSFCRRREENRKTAANLLRQGNTTEALNYLRRCIDVTHKMAVTLMQECRRRNVDCIVAPYEADAQLAFFSREGIADVIVTEDSDLLLFGCKKVTALV